MVKAELSYNPYLLETKVKFNGQEPRINSLVEKYQHEALQNWVNKIPAIFYDEMNGYEFELEFSGTKLEYQALTNAFINAGVTEDSVRLFHKNELDCRKTKIDRITELLEWMGANPNRRFDFHKFMEQHTELFNSGYTCVMINGVTETEELFDEHKVSLEIIENVKELDNTSLVHTPIIMWIDESTLDNMKSNLRYFFKRKDVLENQLFFLIQPTLNKVSIERTIHDLGIEKPQLIGFVEDEIVKCYVETYPVTDYIYEVIKAFRTDEAEIAQVLDNENEKSMISNRAIHQQIDELEEVIKKLKQSLEAFVNRDNLDVLSDMQVVKDEFVCYLQNWKNKKIKITKEYEANQLAQDFQSYMQKGYDTFCGKLEELFKDTQTAIECNYKTCYENAGYNESYIPNITGIRSVEYKTIPIIVNELLEMKEEKYVMPKEDLFGKFFKQTSDKEISPVLETTYYCQEWRDYVIKMVVPYADELIQSIEMILSNYATELAEAYEVHLEYLISDRTFVKDKVSSQLSDEEQRLQEDNDWLIGFQDQLRVIERG